MLEIFGSLEKIIFNELSEAELDESLIEDPYILYRYHSRKIYQSWLKNWVKYFETSGLEMQSEIDKCKEYDQTDTSLEQSYLRDGRIEALINPVFSLLMLRRREARNDFIRSGPERKNKLNEKIVERERKLDEMQMEIVQKEAQLMKEKKAQS